MTDATSAELALLAGQAKEGDADALTTLLAAITDRVYRLALRMVTQPADAEDATQEILIRIMTKLSTFRGDAAFLTWVHRIAVNHLLDRKRSPVERMELTFDAYGEDLLDGLATTSSTSPDAELLAEEVRLACTQAMLTCLDREHRLAYVLGEVFQIASEEAAEICEIPAATYRKRLSRARTRIREFVGRNCGLVNRAAPCRCERRIDVAVRTGRIDPRRPEFATHPVTTARAEMGELFDAATLFRSHPEYAAPERLRSRVSELVRSGRYLVLDGN